MSFRRTLAATCLILTLAGASSAQNQTKQPKTKPAAPAKAAPVQPQTTPVPKAEMSDQVLRLEGVGLTMTLPAGTVVQKTGGGDKASAQIMGADKSWLINIQTPTSKDIKRTAESVAVEVKGQLLASVAVIEQKKNQPLRDAATKGQVMEDIKPVQVSKGETDISPPGVRFYLRLPQGDKEAIIRGYTIFQIGPGRFITFDLTVPEPNYSKARAAYEATIDTVRFADMAAVAAARGAAIERGIGFIESLGTAEYDSAVAAVKDQWFRLSKAGKDGEADGQEVAYRRIRAWKGSRGEIDPSRARDKWTAEDKQAGYVVRIDARFLDGEKIADSVGTYFMTPDRREEAWLIQMVIKDPSQRKPATWREVGARSGSSMSVVTDGAQESKAAQPTVPDRGYIAQVEAFLLPQLLLRGNPKEGANRAGDYGFYTYQSEVGKVQVRRDDLAAVQGGLGAWQIKTRMNEDRPAQVSIYNDRGDLLKTTMPDDRGVWTATTLQKLGQIWQAKGLPMGPQS